MDQQLVGVLLSNKKWNMLLDNKWDQELAEYMRKARELNLPLLFFALDVVDEEERTTKGLKFSQGTTQFLEKVKIPKIIFRPKPIMKKTLVKKWRNLLLDQDYTIINEQYIIKRKHLLEMIKTTPVLRQYFTKDELALQEDYIYTCWLQKNMKDENVEWNITARFSNHENELIWWEDAIKLQFPSFTYSEIKITIQQLELAIMSLMEITQIYYPGIDEIGFQFVITNNGEIKFYQSISKKLLLNKVYQWDYELWTEILTNSFNLALYHWKKEGNDCE